MIKHFINLEWKSLFRSASFGKSIAIKILMVFLAIYFMATFLILGFALFAILKKHAEKGEEITGGGVLQLLQAAVLKRHALPPSFSALGQREPEDATYRCSHDGGYGISRQKVLLARVLVLNENNFVQESDKFCDESLRIV